MKIQVIEETKLFPSRFGRKLEVVARGNGNFKENEVVVALASVHDTKPNEPRKGVRFVKVRRLSEDEIAAIIEAGHCSTANEVVGVEGKRIKILTKYFLNWEEEVYGRNPLLTQEDFWVEASNVELKVRSWMDLYAVLWFNKSHTSYTVIPKEIVRELLEKSFSYDVDQKLAEEKVRVQEEKEVWAKHQIQDAKNRAWIESMFTKEHPEFLETHRDPILSEMYKWAVEKKLATYIKSERSGGYSNSMKEISFYESLYSMKIGGETVEFRLMSSDD